MSRERKLIFDASLIFVVSILASGLGYLIRMILSRQLSLEEFGLFYAVFTFVGFFIVLRHLGLDFSLRKFIPEYLIKKEYVFLKSSIKFIFLVNFFIALILSFIFILFSKFLSENYFKNELAFPLLIIFSIYFVFYAAYGFLTSVFVGFQKSKIYSFDIFFINSLVLIGILFFGKYGIFSIALSYLFASIFGVLIGTVLLFKSFNFSKYKSKIDKNLIFKLFSYGLPLMLASIGFMVIGQIDILMLIKFRTLTEVGIYNVVLPTATILVTLGSSVALAMLPFVSEYWAVKKFQKIKEIIELLYKKIFILIVPIILIVFIFAELILKVLFGENFIIGSGALRILSLGSIFFSVATINNSILSAIGKPKLVTKIILVAMFLNIILNLIFIPKYGIIGAAFATVSAYLFILLFSSYFVRNIAKIDIPIGDWIKTFFSGLFFIFIVIFMKSLLKFNVWVETFIVLVIGLSAYFILVLCFGLIDRKEFFNLFKIRN
jgi:stage V sporulation protein B